MSNVYFTSDPHFGHKNICKGITTWKPPHDRCRDFTTLEQMNSAIVDGINNTVGQNDTLYCLGDWSFGGIEQVWNFRKRIVCKNIHLILGNHDHHIENNRKIFIPYEELETYRQSSTTAHNYIHELNMSDDSKGILVPSRSIFQSVNHLLIKKIGGYDMTLSHYAMRTWDKAHHGTWMLHGHSHGSLGSYGSYNEGKFIKYKTEDVGIDAVYNLIGQYRPLSLDELVRMFKNRANLQVDHHNSNTN